MARFNLTGLYWEDERPHKDCKLSSVAFDEQLKIHDEQDMYNNLAVRISSLDFLIAITDALKEVQNNREYLAFIKSGERLTDKTEMSNVALELSEFKLSSLVKEFGSSGKEGLQYLVDAYGGQY